MDIKSREDIEKFFSLYLGNPVFSNNGIFIYNVNNVK